MFKRDISSKKIGQVPDEYAILPMGFLNFHYDGDLDRVKLIGMNIEGKEHLADDLGDFELESIDLDLDFLSKINALFRDNGTQSFLSPIYHNSSQYYQCKIVRLTEDNLGCFFCIASTSDLKGKEANNINFDLEQDNFKNLFRTFFNHVPVGIVIMNKEGQIKDVNKKFTQLFKYKSEELLNQDINQFIVPPDSSEEGRSLTSQALAGEVIKHETVRRTKDGEEVTVLIQAAPIIKDGVQEGTFIIYQDFTQRARALKKIKETGRKLEELLKVVPEMDSYEEKEEVCQITVDTALNILKLDSCVIVLKDEDKLIPAAVSGNLTIDNFPVVNLTTGIVGKTYRTGNIIYCEDLAEVDNINDIGADFESVISIPLGKYGVFQALSTEKAAYSGEDIKLAKLLVGHTEEVLKQLSLKKQLYYRANYDALTGLINRHHFNHLLTQEVEKTRRYNYGLTFLMIDINNFKGVNDALGHLVGDRVLRTVAKIIKKNVRSSDYVIRYGGDEFIVLMPEKDVEQDEEGVEIVMKRIKKAVQEWYDTKAAPEMPPFSISVGAAYWSPETDMTIEEVLHEADKFMYSEKRCN